MTLYELDIHELSRIGAKVSKYAKFLLIWTKELLFIKIIVDAISLIHRKHSGLFSVLAETKLLLSASVRLDSGSAWIERAIRVSTPLMMIENKFTNSGIIYRFLIGIKCCKGCCKVQSHWGVKLICDFKRVGCGRHDQIYISAVYQYVKLLKGICSNQKK